MNDNKHLVFAEVEKCRAAIKGRGPKPATAAYCCSYSGMGYWSVPSS